MKDEEKAAAANDVANAAAASFSMLHEKMSIVIRSRCFLFPAEGHAPLALLQHTRFELVQHQRLQPERAVEGMSKLVELSAVGAVDDVGIDGDCC